MKIMRRLYDWVLSWSDSPYGSWALFAIAFAESSFFPIPPDVLLVALAVGAHKKAFRFALICTAGSVLGGMLGYLIGWQFMALIGDRIVALFGFADKFVRVEQLYNTWDAWVVFIAGFTPIPYKVFTIAAGLFTINFPIFVLASALGRAGRFCLVAGLIYLFGPTIKAFIDRYFNLVVTAFTVLLIGGFVLIAHVM
ncbi:YqaA family protein [Desulfoluna spongiiphila]|uniref:Membrane protein YqaA, SNARE-associated domain n=1 Tax=Desulfoluna spongiiphila TaxID=419481 RepID=A0A1G5I2W3_9BACT|nr:YqaA family protein [Desulfoluna spongiiphila]SCY70383.1 membrane protein YqaA, SNARE-associated domain [Desulfoluna spongiiphila]VVS92679.1 snare associated golgi protein [Desulfoluna spongiiphila]